MSSRLQVVQNQDGDQKSDKTAITADAQVQIVADVGQHRLWGLITPSQKCSLVPTEHIFTCLPT